MSDDLFRLIALIPLTLTCIALILLIVRMPR